MQDTHVGDKKCKQNSDLENQINKNHQIYKDRCEADIKIGLKETVAGDIK